MRLLYVVGDPSFRLSDNAGYTRHILQCKRALTELGHEVHMLAAANGKASGQQKSFSDKAKGYVPSWIRPLVKDVSKLVYDAQLAKRIGKAVKELEPDVIYNRLALFHRSAITAGKSLGIPTILEVNACIAREAGKYYGLGLRSLADKSERYVFQEATAIIAVSTQLKQELLEYGLPAEKIFVNPNGVDSDEFSPAIDASEIRHKYGLEDGTVVGFLGTLAPWHGVQRLLDAARIVCQKCPDARFLIVGSGDEYEFLQSMVAEYGIRDKVVFTGSVPFHEVPKHVNAMDIATAPYPPMESFYFSPIKIFEYMAAGRAIVASDLGQIGEVIEDGCTGALVKAGDIGQLADTLIHLLGQPKLREEFGARARDAVMTNYTWRHNAERILRVCRAIMAEGTTSENLR